MHNKCESDHRRWPKIVLFLIYSEWSAIFFTSKVLFSIILFFSKRKYFNIIAYMVCGVSKFDDLFQLIKLHKNMYKDVWYFNIPATLGTVLK